MTEKEVFTNYIGENIDRLVTLDLKASGGIHHLYSAARALYNAPICLLAARKIKECVKKNDVVLITTGAVVSPAGLGETDGPLGAAALARILSLGLEAKVIILTEEILLEIVKAACRGAELNILKFSDLTKRGEFDLGKMSIFPVPDIGKVSVLPFPLREEEAERETEHLLSSLKPKLLIAVEKTGPNDLGIYHSYGLDFSAYHIKIGPLFSKAKQNGIMTIGVGDRGNEVGLGTIKDAARKVHPYGANCRCPCNSGAANSTVVDIVVPAAVSNWGAYGIETCLGILLERIDLIHDENMEVRMLNLSINAGAVDGMTGLCQPAVDGFSEDIQVCIAGMLRTVSRSKFTVSQERVELYRIP